MARLTLEIPDEAHRKLKTLAASSGLTMKELILSRTLAPAAPLEQVPSTGGRLENVLSKLLADNRDILRTALETPTVAEPSPEVADIPALKKSEAPKPKYLRLQLRPESPKPQPFSTLVSCEEIIAAMEADHEALFDEKWDEIGALDKVKIAKLPPVPAM